MPDTGNLSLSKPPIYNPSKSTNTGLMSTPSISETKSDDKENNDISMPIGYGKYNNTQCGWLEKRSKYVKKWRARFCVLKMSHCLMITYKYQFDQVTSTKALNDKKNQTDSILFGDISCVQEIEFNINGEEYDYNGNNNKKKLKKSNQYFGFKVFINNDISNQDIIENKKHYFQCQYEGFDLQTIKYQKKDFDSYLFRCKNKYAIRLWIDLIQDCMIRAKYYNCQRSIQCKLININTFAIIPEIKEREIKYYRLLLGLPHNQNITILWEKLGFAISMKQEKDINTFNLCCNAFETAHCLNKDDSKILYNFITALDNFNNIDIFTKNRIKNINDL